MFEILAAGLAILAFIFSRKALEQIGTLRLKVEQLEARLGVAPTAPLAPAAAPAISEPLPRESIPVAPETPETESAPQPAPSSPPPSQPPVAEAVVPAGPGVEERLGTRWVVWIGGLMLALGGLFLVRYSIEAGLLGPKMRVVLGWLFAAALLGAGEWARRKENLSSIAALPIANIPAILTAAGTAVAFGVTYAAYGLYELLPAPIAFLLLGAVALATLAAALLHGPALAGLGVVGAFVTPLMVASDTPNYWALYVYLAVVTGAALALARVRLWRWLALTTVALALLWSLVEFDDVDLIAPHGFYLIAGFTLTALLVVVNFLFGPTDKEGGVDRLSSSTLSAWLIGAMVLTLPNIQSTGALAVFALLVAATLGIAWRSEAATAAVPAAGAMVALVFGSWFVQTTPDPTMLPSALFPDLGARPLDTATTPHLVLGAGFALAFGLTGFLMQGRARSALVATLWSAAGTATPILLLIALYARIAHLDRSIPFAIAAVALAGAFAFAAEQLTRRDAAPGQQTALALYATAALGSLALGLTFALEKGWLTVALALMAPAAAWVSTKRPIPFLRWLAGAMAVIVTARLGWEPRIAGTDVGTTPIVNWLLWGYGAPAASFALAGWMMRRQADDAPTRMVEAAAILFTTLLVFLEIRHFMTGGDIYRQTSALAEIALQLCAALAMAIGLERLSARTGSIVHTIGALVLTAIAGIATVLGLMLFANPMLTGRPVGDAVFNLLLLAYAAPALLAFLLAKVAADRRASAHVNTLAGAALVLALAYVTLQIRRVYHGPVLTSGLTSDAEQYTYSVAWLAFGVVLLAAGLLLQSQRARLASAAVIGLTIVKAFFIDMSGLTGVWRALSFIGLGLVLVAIGWLYQRILFPKKASSE